MKRVTALPRKPLLCVVGRPDVERGERVDGPAVGDRVVRGDLGPGANAYPVGLGDLHSTVECIERRLAIAPDALLECAGQLGLVRGPHQVGALMVERRIKEETVVVEFEMLVGLANAALAER